MNHLAMTNSNLSNMSNLSMLYAVEPNKKVREQIGGTASSLVMAGSITTSPNKRMRTISKKKWIFFLSIIKHTFEFFDYFNFLFI